MSSCLCGLLSFEMTFSYPLQRLVYSYQLSVEKILCFACLLAQKKTTTVFDDVTESVSLKFCAVFDRYGQSGSPVPSNQRPPPPPPPMERGESAVLASRRIWGFLTHGSQRSSDLRVPSVNGNQPALRD